MAIGSRCVDHAQCLWGNHNQVVLFLVSEYADPHRDGLSRRRSCQVQGPSALLWKAALGKRKPLVCSRWSSDAVWQDEK